MDVPDILIVAAVALAAIGGYRLGFFTRVLSWLGLGGGIIVAAHFLPRVISAAALRDGGARLVLAALVLIGGAFVGQAVGVLAGSRLHRILPPGPLRAADRGVGGLVGAAGVIAALWLLLPSISSVAGWPARAAEDSVISRWVSNDLPSPPDTLESLRRLVGGDQYPQVFADLEPDPSVGPPPASDPLGATVTRSVSASTVKVAGQACDRILEGSGFAVAPGLIVTNAHVVAGEAAHATTVLLPTGRRLAARVVRYDPDRDLALLDVAGLDERPLPLAAGTIDSRDAVFGHPDGQASLSVQPATVAREIVATGRDLYNRHDTSRDVYVLAASLEPGDSGGAVVDRSGAVIGVAFAIALDQSRTAYALASREVDEILAAPRTGRAVSTDGCLSG